MTGILKQSKTNRKSKILYSTVNDAQLVNIVSQHSDLSPAQRNNAIIKLFFKTSNSGVLICIKLSVGGGHIGDFCTNLHRCISMHVDHIVAALGESVMVVLRP